MGKGALIAGLGLLVVALIALAGLTPPSRTSLLLQGELARQASALEASAAKYTQSAAEMKQSAAAMMKSAHERKAEAANVQAMETYLQTAQSELDAYSANAEGLVSATNRAKLRGDMTQFPKEAAELHALLDHSLGEADSAAVKIARMGSASKAAPMLPRRAAAAVVAGGLKAKTHQQVLRATAASPLQKMVKHAKPMSNLDKVKATLKQLGAVKAFAREAAHGQARALAASALLNSVKKAAAHGTTHVLQQQPAPLLGAMNVRDGELVGGDPKYKSASVGLTKENPKFIEMQNTLMPTYNPEDDKLLACGKHCQKEIVHSTIGLTYKVATKCVPGCANGDYTIRTNGKPLPQWQTAQELHEQDTFCDEDLVYMKCKWQSLDALCDKMTEFMPQYCLSHQNEGIFQQCQKVELYDINENVKFKEGCQHAQTLKQDPMPEGCDAVLVTTAWQNATSPEDMMKGLEDEE